MQMQMLVPGLKPSHRRRPYQPVLAAFGLSFALPFNAHAATYSVVDMGAIERGDLIMYNGFGTYPAS